MESTELVKQHHSLLVRAKSEFLLYIKLVKLTCGGCVDRHLLSPGTGTFVLPVLPFLVRRGFHPPLGARPLRDAVEKYVGDAVLRDLIAGGTRSCEIAVDAGGERLWVGRVNAPVG